MPLARPLVASAFAFATLVVAGVAAAVPPTGYLDNAGCDAIAGWAQDPDEPAAGIAVHLYLGGPAGSGAPGVAVTANVYREDLCAAIGSCEHGFAMAPPLSLLDGQPRNVHAYGIDAPGGTNPELGSSPRVLQCAPSAVGVRRKLVSLSAVDAWKFSPFWDVLPLPAAEAAGLAAGRDLPDAPVLVTSDDGTGALWLDDGGVRRAVPPEAVAAWHLDPAQAKVISAAELSGLVPGPSLRPRPVVVMFEGVALIDDVLPEVPAATTSSAGAGGGGGDGGSGGGDGGNGGTGGGGATVSIAKPAACAMGGDGAPRFAMGLLGVAAVIAMRRSRRR